MPRSRRKRLRLQTQLLIMLFVFGLVPMTLAVGVGYRVSRETIIDQSRDALLELASRQANYLLTEIRREQLILRTIAGQIAPSIGLAGGDLSSLLAASLADDGVFDGLRLVDTDGTILADVALRETAPAWPVHRRDHPVSSGLALHRERDTVVAYLLTVPVNGATDGLWLQGHVRAADFGKNFDIPLHLLGGVELGLFDDQRHVIVIPHEHSRAALLDLLPVAVDDADRVLNGNLGSEPALTYGTRLAEFDWFLLAALPLRVVLEPVNDLLLLAVLGVAGLTVLIVVAGLAASRVVTTPVREVALAAASFGATGEYDRPTHPGVAETEALIASFQDMATSLRRSREEIERLHAQEMERAHQLATVGELASGVAHEIRNPLTGLLGVMQVIRKRLTHDGQTTPMLEEAERQLRRIESTTSRLLEYARPPELRKAEIDVRDVIARAVRVVASVADRAGVRIAAADADRGAQVLADPELIVQVLVNLLLNAVDATPMRGTVRIEAAMAREGVEVRVIDHGPGVPPERRVEIFRPFLTTKNQGTGLGLSISQQIVNRHGGSLWVEETPGGGATLVMGLPSTIPAGRS